MKNISDGQADMNELKKEILEKELTNKIIKSFYNVYNKLGYGFLKKVYEKSLIVEFTKQDIECESQKPIGVYYDDIKVSEYFADIIVENRVIIELKAAESLKKEHEAQLYNYLKATNIEVGLLFNFGKEPQFKRMIFENKYKK
ncbi:hypothetical protein MNBD_IGNAVI01-178 [hydrothermal vent metagenome]|uniref:NADH:ubiquinone oxidoreductase subunit 5 (Chain L)/Multisubunit Na+/H+ antiporter, MnhA subunit n=1 Tax=hydrothermal vent metagenome TaxID=652676 RepID=A0A3B1CNU8_9ZZZZ